MLWHISSSSKSSSSCQRAAQVRCLTHSTRRPTALLIRLAFAEGVHHLLASTSADPPFNSPSLTVYQIHESLCQPSPRVNVGSNGTTGVPSMPSTSPSPDKPAI